jgi:hypothetical protein
MRAIRHSLILLEANSCPLTLRVTRAGPSSVAEVQAQRGERLDARVGAHQHPQAALGPLRQQRLLAVLAGVVRVAMSQGDAC